MSIDLSNCLLISQCDLYIYVSKNDIISFKLWLLMNYLGVSHLKARFIIMFIYGQKHTNFQTLIKINDSF